MHLLAVVTQPPPAPLISDTVGVALVTGLVSILTAVLTVWLTNRHARRESKAVRDSNATEAAAIRAHTERESEIERREHRRSEVRRLVAEFVNAADDWTGAHDTMVPVYYTSAGDQSFWLEWPDTDSGRKMREDALRFTRASGELRLIVQDQPLRDRLKEALDSINDGGPMAALLKEGKETRGKIPEQSVMRDAFAHYRDVRARIQAVEDRGAELLRGDL
ncbi:hypothetical protein [Microbacterium sp.]|uniref:hypothetical protein n=1 Tax=Microbacterium sp. TaxID=51671 RepID=UPI0039E57EA8